MNTAEVFNLATEKEKRANPPLVMPSPDPIDPNGIDWLEKLPVGTAFLADTKNDPNAYVQHEYLIKGRSDKTIILLRYINGEYVELPVKPRKFCRVYGLHEVTLTAEEREALMERNKNLTDTELKEKEGDNPGE